MTGTIIRPQESSIVVRLPPALHLDERQLFALCRLNRDLRIERSAEGDLEIMPPTAGATGNRNARISGLLYMWASEDGTGELFDSSTGFILPNGATRSPDASWVQTSRLAGLSTEQWEESFLRLSPDFVIELRSASDNIRDLQAKMREYMENGVRLGWLLDPRERRVYVFRPHTEVQVLDDPARVDADPELPGFTLELGMVWGATPDVAFAPTGG